jgi:hypothetical protein
MHVNCTCDKHSPFVCFEEYFGIDDFKKIKFIF